VGGSKSKNREGFEPIERLADARLILRKLLDLDPEDADALATLGWLAVRFDNDLTTAACHLAKAIQIAPESTSILSTTGSFLFRLARYDQAIKLARKVTRVDPLNAHAYANLGVYSLFAGDYNESIAAYNTALEISPGFTGASYAIGLAHLFKNEPARAIEAMSREGDDEFRTKGSAMACWSAGDAPR